MKSALYPFQRKDVDFLLSHPRCINGNAMGLGKTIEALALMEHLDSRHNLIVCPKTLISEWWYQINEWLGEDCLTPNPNGNKLAGLDLFGPRFVALNYDLLSREYFAQLSMVPWDFIIFDECHRMKNWKAKRTKAGVLLTFSNDKLPRIVMMSGTPMQNNPADLFPLFHIINPRLYRSYSQWVSMFCETVLMQVGNRYFSQIVGAKNEHELNQLLHMHMVRNEKQDVLKDLPPKQFRVVPVELGSEMSQYNQMEHDLFALLDSGELITAPAVIAQLTRLRQICLDPNLLSSESRKVSSNTTKTQTLVELIEGTDDKVVVYSYFEQYTRLIAQELDKRSISYVTITGQVNTQDRGRAVTEFQTGEPKVCLGTIGAMGEGITLTAAHTCIFTDLHWNPKCNEQAEDRLYGRLNDAHGVLIIDLWCNGTIEDHMHRVIRRKEKMFESIVIRNVVDSMRRSHQWTQQNVTATF